VAFILATSTPPMKILSSLAALFSGRAPAEPPPTVTDLELEIVQLDPPDGSAVEAGQDITVTVAWRYSAPANGLGVWAKPVAPEGVGGSYEGDGGEAGRAGAGRLVRTVCLHEPAAMAGVLLVARDAHSREIFRRTVPVNYTFVPSAAQDARMRDGQDSRIVGVEFDPPSPARLAPGSRVAVRIGYDAHSAHGLRPLAIPVTDCAMTYDSAPEVPVHGRGHLTQHFTVGEPCALRQVRVLLWNEGRVAVDERLVDVDFLYER